MALKFMNRIGWLATLLLSSTALSPFAMAQQAPASDAGADEEDVILVEGVRPKEATALALEMVQFGTQVQVITAEEIETGGFTNFGEAAAGLIRGANVGYSPDEGEFTIRIDGGTDRDTLLLVDGVPFFDRSSPSEDLWPATAIDPRMIQSVEVYRGGQSLYFGSNGGLGVVSIKTKAPDGATRSQFGFYSGSFKTRELYGNTTFPLDEAGKHSVLVFGRSYKSDAHTLFSPSAYGDNVAAMGGFQDFPYDFNSLGLKYLWKPDAATQVRLGASYTTVDFHDSFPTSTAYSPNFTEFPIYTANLEREFGPRFVFQVDSHYQLPRLKNHEMLPQVCRIPRLQDLPAPIETIARGRGITAFNTAAQFEAFAASVGIPAGCVTNPFGTSNGAATSANNSYLFNRDPRSPFFNQPYGTIENPFPVGAPMGYVSETATTFGNRSLVKGFGSTDNLLSGYKDWGVNVRGTYTLNDYLTVVLGAQHTGYTDNSDPAFGVQDVTLTSNGLYGDLRVSLPVLEGFSGSFAARKDFNDPFADQSIWKIGLRQEFPFGVYARASGGTSYSAPKIDEIGAYGATNNLNPGLENQEVETFNAGFGIDGTIRGGSFNFEVGYFRTDINNQFGDRAVGSICTQYALGGPNTPSTGALPIATINANRASIVPPDAFCATAAAERLDASQTVAINALAKQEIEGLTLDFAVDFDLIQADISYTRMDSLEPNPVFGLTQIREGATGAAVNGIPGTVVPGSAGSQQKRQSGERPEWSISGLVTFTPSDRWIFALNPRWQGPEYAYAGTTAARLVDAQGNRVVPDMNFGNYFVLNGSVQYFMGKDRQHRFLVRGVNLLAKDYFERGAAGASQTLNRAVVRGEVTQFQREFYTNYGWNGKPRSAWIQYDYRF
jgi:outer membrane receptor protein involved in Fe transport